MLHTSLAPAAAARAAPVPWVPSAVRRPTTVRRTRAAASEEGMSWLTQQAGQVEEDSLQEAAIAAAVAADEAAAARVGLHLRGRATFLQGATDENDPARHPYHRDLKTAAVDGRWEQAEAVLEEMALAGHVPGPRAYHALAFAHVKKRHPSGALDAIRRCWNAGITPLPETYAAVVSAHILAGDLETAEAVWSSNRRAGVDCTKSWQLLVAAWFKSGQGAKALEAYNQGEAEGLEPSEAVFEGLVGHLCDQGDLEGARSMLQQMKDRKMVRSIQHYSPLIHGYVAAGQPQAAYAAIEEFLAGGTCPPGMMAVCDTVLEAQLETAESAAEAAATVQRMKVLVRANGMQPGWRFFEAQLRASLRLHDVQPAIQAFRALQILVPLPLARLEDDVVASLLLELSRANLPAEMYEVLLVMSYNGQRPIPDAALAPDEHGCTMLGAWAWQRLQRLHQQPAAAGEAGEAAGQGSVARASLVIDGVTLDPLLLVALDPTTLAPLAVSRMGVREMRAELAARRAPVSGNKKNLAKRLQNLRQLDGIQVSSKAQRLRSEQDAEKTRKVAVVVKDRFWLGGRLVEEIRYESEREVEAAPVEEEGEDNAEWEGEMEDEGPSTRRMNAAAEDELFEDPFNDDKWLENEAPQDNAAGIPSYAHFSSPAAGPRDAATIALCAVVDLRAQPSAADLQALAAYVATGGGTAAAVLLAAALDQQPVPVEGTSQLREELAALAARRAEEREQEIDFEAAVRAVLGDRASNPEQEEILAELAMYERDGSSQ